MKWIRGHVLGRGSAATVSTATTINNELFAVKSVELPQAETLRKEQHFLSILNSPHVVSYKGCDITTEDNKMFYNIFIDYMSRGSIIDMIKARKARTGEGLTDMEIAMYTRHILQGLEYIHSKVIVHCDIKGTNILINEYGAKIGDFGCAKLANQIAPISGTPMFMAPEVARGEEQGFPADIWAVGCTVIEIATGGSPWPNATNPASILYQIAFSGKIPAIPAKFSDQLRDFVSKCLIRDPKQRWTATELLKHPYVQQLDCIDSPTSVLDQDVWNSMKESSISSSSGIDFGQFDVRFGGLGLLESLRQRTEQLAGKSEMANWSSEMGESDWMTVR